MHKSDHFWRVQEWAGAERAGNKTLVAQACLFQESVNAIQNYLHTVFRKKSNLAFLEFKNMDEKRIHSMAGESSTTGSLPPSKNCNLNIFEPYRLKFYSRRLHPDQGKLGNVCQILKRTRNTSEAPAVRKAEGKTHPAVRASPRQEYSKDNRGIRRTFQMKESAYGILPTPHPRQRAPV